MVLYVVVVGVFIIFINFFIIILGWAGLDWACGRLSKPGHSATACMDACLHVLMPRTEPRLLDGRLGD